MVTVLRQYGKAKHGGPEVEMRFAQVWTRCVRLDVKRRSDLLDAMSRGVSFVRDKSAGQKR